MGSSILELLCLDYPEKVIGYHTTSLGNPEPYTPEEKHITVSKRCTMKMADMPIFSTPPMITYSLKDHNIMLIPLNGPFAKDRRTW
ncbi:hypothetical protein H4O14_19685 [Bacillus sp. PAMC26568]|nr:hypothetical protein H4O14_19685 [Bacillus sp. PAMC26568]